MKITSSQLKQLVKEELRHALDEEHEDFRTALERAEARRRRESRYGITQQSPPRKSTLEKWKERLEGGEISFPRGGLYVRTPKIRFEGDDPSMEEADDATKNMNDYIKRAYASIDPLWSRRRVKTKDLDNVAKSISATLEYITAVYEELLELENSLQAERE